MKFSKYLIITFTLIIHSLTAQKFRVVTKANEQSFKVIGTDTVNFKDNKGYKQGKWIENTGFGNTIGNYKNNKKEGTWRNYTWNGELEDEEQYKNGKKLKQGSEFRRIRAKFGDVSGDGMKMKEQFNLDFHFYEITVANGRSSSAPINGVTVTLLELINSKYEFISETNTNEESKINNIVLLPNKNFKIRFYKKGYLSREYVVDTHLNNPTDSIRNYNSLFYISFFRKFNPKLSPDALKMPSGVIKYYSNIRNLSQDNIYYNYLNDKFFSLDKKVQENLITELENSNDTEFLDLQEQNKLKSEEISKLNSEKLLKEAEAKANKLEAEQKSKELELISKERLIQQFMISQQKLLADKKEKEINELSQAQLINELKLSGQESEIKQQKIEGEKKKQELEKAKIEQELKTKEVEQQKTIRNYILIGLVLVLGLVFIVYRSLLQNKKAKSIIEEQKKTVESQKHLVEEKQKEILDSIKYAKRIQQAHLPSDIYVAKNLDRLKKS